MHSLHVIKNQIANYEHEYNRSSGCVKLLAVTKGQPLAKILELYSQGQHAFGENYLQEALEKISVLTDQDIEWHFIGKIQRNKTKNIAKHFSWVQSLDDLTIAKRLNDQRPENLPALNVCIEVNINDEEAKSGIQPNELVAFAKQCQLFPRLYLRGLMTIPKMTIDFEEQRQTFKKMQQLFQMLIDQGFVLDTLSMGMSDDFRAAIAEGSTMVRIGRALMSNRDF